MKHAGFIYGSYALTFGAVIVYAVRIKARARKLAKELAPKDQRWM